MYFRQVSDAFAKRFEELGGKVVDQQSFTSFQNDIGPVISKVAGEKADVISFVTAFGELPQFVGGIRSAGNTTPIVNSWGGDGTYWNPKSPQVTDYYVDNYASSFGDDPNPAVNKLLAALLAAKQVPYTASFVLGAATIDALADGAEAARRLDQRRRTRPGDRGLPRRRRRSPGPITFTRRRCTASSGRPWRIMQVQNNKETFVRMWKTQKAVEYPLAVVEPEAPAVDDRWPGDALRATDVSRARSRASTRSGA